MFFESASKTFTIIKSKPIINKNAKIIVRLNDNEQKLVLQKTLFQNIVENINARIMQLETTIKDIKAIKKLFSKDIAIYTIRLIVRSGIDINFLT